MFPLVVPFVGTAPANADAPDPVGTILGAVQQGVQTATSSGSAPETRPVHQVVESVTRPPEKRPSRAPATQHAGASTADVTSHGAPLAEVSGNHVGTTSSGRPGGQATLLGVAGTSVIGSHAGPGHTGRSPVPSNPLCERSGGALCLDLLYADSGATSSSAATRTGLAALCLGGDDPTGAGCSGQQVGVAQGQASYDEHGSASSAGLADACLTTGAGCAVDADVLSSASGAGTGRPDLLGITLGGTRFELPRDTAHADVPTGCRPAGVACLVLNALTATPEGQAKHAAGAGVGNHALGATAGSSSSDAATPPAGATSVDPSTAASAQLVDLGTADQPLLGLSHNASADGDHQATADGTLLSVAGVELIGSHSTSDGTHHEGPIPSNELGRQVGHPLCAASGGSACADLLYADSSASHSADAADASSRTGLLALCLGGDDPTGTSCSGLTLGLGQGASQVHRTSDGASSTSSTSLADACLAGTAGCAASADALASQGSADSSGEHGSAGSIADVGLGGAGAGAPGDPLTLGVPTGCASGSSSPVLCAALDQDQQAAGASGAATQQTVLSLGTLGDVLGLTAAHTAAGAHVAAPTGGFDGSVPHGTTTGTSTGTGPHSGSTGSGSSTSSNVVDATASALAGAIPTTAIPNTGGPWAGSVPLALLLIAAGAACVARSWRREVG